MKRTYTILFLIALLSCITGKETYAQETVPEGYVLVDSVIYRPVATVDTTLVGKDVFLLPKAAIAIRFPADGFPEPGRIDHFQFFRVFGQKDGVHRLPPISSRSATASTGSDCM